MREVLKTRKSFSGRRMTDHELDITQGIHETVVALLDLVSASSSALAASYRRRVLTPASAGVHSNQRDSRLGSGSSAPSGLCAGTLGWGGECLAGLAEERSSSDGRLLRSVRALRKSIARVTERASFLLARSSSSESYLISIASPLEAMRARQGLNDRIGPQWQDVWARLRSKGMATDEGGVLFTCTLQHMSDTLRDPCTEPLHQTAGAARLWDRGSFPGKHDGGALHEGDLSSFTVEVLACLAASPVTAVAKDLQLKLQSVLRLGLALEQTLAVRRLESELGTMIINSPVRRNVLLDHVRVLSEGILPRDEAQRHLGYLLETQLEERRGWREYLRLEVSAAGIPGVCSGEWGLANQVRARVCGWLRGLCKRSEKAARQAAPVLQVVRIEQDDSEVSNVTCTVAVSLDPLRAIASLASDENYSQGLCDLHAFVDGIVEEYGRTGAGFGGLDVHHLARYEGSIFIQLLSIIPGVEGGIAAVGHLPEMTSRGLRREDNHDSVVGRQRGLQEEEMYTIFASHLRRTLAAEHPEWNESFVQADIEARWRAHCYSMFEMERLSLTPLMLSSAEITVEFRRLGGSTAPSGSEPSAEVPTAGGAEWESGVTIRMPDGLYRPEQLAQAFNDMLMLECGSQHYGNGHLGLGSMGLRMIVLSGGGSGLDIKFVCEKSQFRIRASSLLVSALGLAPLSDGRCLSARASRSGAWELSAGNGGRTVWWVAETRARIAKRWIAELQIKEIAAITGLPPQNIRVLPPRDGDLEAHGSYVRCCLEVVSSRQVPLAIIRQSCEVLLRRFNGQHGPPANSWPSDVLSRVLTLSASEGMVPPIPSRAWQSTGSYVLSSTADLQTEAAQLSGMLLPALRHSFARQRVDFRWAGVSSPFYADHRVPEGLRLARCLSHLNRQRLPGGAANGESGPRLFVGLLAELIDPLESAQQVRTSGDLIRYSSMGSVGVQMGAGALRSLDAHEAFVLIRDPKFMLSSAFKSLSLQAPTVKRCFTEHADEALQASKDLKRTLFETVGCERAISYSAAYRGRAVNVEEALLMLDLLRIRLLMCEELGGNNSQVSGQQDEQDECRRELLVRLQGARDFITEHLKLTRDQRVRGVAEDEDLRVLCESLFEANKRDKEARAASNIAARAVRLEVEEMSILVFSSIANTVFNFCEAAPLEQPVHRHLVSREQQERRLHHHLSRCADLRANEAARQGMPVSGREALAAGRAHVDSNLHAFVEGDARSKPPVLLLEGAPYSGKTCTLAQWLAGRHDALLPQDSGPQNRLLDAGGRDLAVSPLTAVVAPTRHVLVFLFADGMSVEEVLVHLAIEVELQVRN